MEFPERIENHIKESDSISILNNKLPREWIVREITERDYGVDLYLEIVGANKLVTGDLVALQVKGTTGINFTENKSYTFSGIKKSTVNYWKGLPVQVFIILVDVETKNVFWNNTKQNLRSNKFDWNNDSFSFYFFEEKNLDEASGIELFKTEYNFEKNWPQIEKSIVDCITSFNSLGPYYLYLKRNKIELELSATLQSLTIQFYQTFYTLSKYLLNNSPKTLTHWYEEHSIQSNRKTSSSVIFSYAFALKLISEIVSDFWECANKSQQIITSQESNYWESKYPYIYKLLIDKPILFEYEDWMARYYWDEYENETDDLTKCIFSDLSL